MIILRDWTTFILPSIPKEFSHISWRPTSHHNIISTAFNTLNHNILSKLSNLNFSVYAMKWMESYLTMRSEAPHLGTKSHHLLTVLLVSRKAQS